MIKIVVYDDTKTVVEEEITGFASAGQAANYRDHQDRLAYKITVLEQDVREPLYSGNYGDTSQADGTEGTGAGQAQVIQYHDEAGHRWANFRFIGLVFIFFMCFLISGASVFFNGFGW